jgi:Arf-GAP/GTPase/ANK repeat/PH domain-containing protein 1/3
MEAPKIEASSSGMTGGSFMFKQPNTPQSKAPSFRRKSKSDLSSMTPLPSTKDKEDIPTLTPSVVRKQKRRSHIFTNLTGKNKNDDNSKNGSTELLGSGRTIPIRQGYLYKKSLKTLNKDWKKKYVTLTSDGTLTYHPTLHDYMSNSHGKEIPLKHTTVKVPSKYRLSKAISSGPNSLSAVPTSGHGTPYNHSISQEGSESVKAGKKEKKHRRTKSNLGKHSEEDSDGAEFTIVSLENKEWRFDAESSTERQEWVTAIEEQIFTSLQLMESDKSKTSCSADRVTVQKIRGVRGNDRCADCNQPDPVWASLNIGTLICIECSGIHRNLGTHISKVRSLDLDDWSPPQVAVMMALGNEVVNEVYEARIPLSSKPSASSPRENKESFIRLKYETKAYLLQLRVNNSDNFTSKQVDMKLMEAVNRGDMQTLVLILARHPNHLKNCSVSGCYPLHAAATAGKLAICQFLIWVSLLPFAI